MNAVPQILNSDLPVSRDRGAGPGHAARVPDFDLAPDVVPEITWPSATCTLQGLPLRINRRMT